MKTAFKKAEKVKLTKVANGLFTFVGDMGKFTFEGTTFDVHGGYITVPAMHKIDGKRRKIEIALSATSNGKHATYVILGKNDELAMDVKFLSRLGWEGLESTGKVDSMKKG